LHVCERVCARVCVRVCVYTHSVRITNKRFYIFTSTRPEDPGA
jgi:hypothetical protein